MSAGQYYSPRPVRGAPHLIANTGGSGPQKKDGGPPPPAMTRTPLRGEKMYTLQASGFIERCISNVRAAVEERASAPATAAKAAFLMRSSSPG